MNTNQDKKEEWYEFGREDGDHRFQCESKSGHAEVDEYECEHEAATVRESTMIDGEYSL